MQWRPIPESLRNGISPIRLDNNSNREGNNDQQQNGENSGSDSALEPDISPRNENGREGTAINPEPDQKDLLKHLTDQVCYFPKIGRQALSKPSGRGFKKYGIKFFGCADVRKMTGF